MLVTKKVHVEEDMPPKTIHEVHFPRYDTDVNSRKRTLFHMTVDEQTWDVDDELRLIAHPNFPRCACAILTNVRQVKLLAELEGDLAKLGEVNRESYLASWDALHPELPSTSDPTVWRIEFRYSIADQQPDPPEWSLAV